MKVSSSAGQVEPRSTDVLLGRGNGVSIWKGNINFRQIVWKYRDEYRQAVRYQKGKIAEKVFEHISTLSPPGRFLEMIEDDKFYVVDKERAIEKTCQALREKKNRMIPNATVGSARLTKLSKSTKERYKPEQIIAIAPTPVHLSPPESACLDRVQVPPTVPVPLTGTETTRGSILHVKTHVANVICSSRARVVTPDHASYPGLSSFETKEKNVKRSLFPNSNISVAPSTAFTTLQKKVKIEHDDVPYSRNSGTNSNPMSNMGTVEPSPVDTLACTTTDLYPFVSMRTNTSTSSRGSRINDLYVSDFTFMGTDGTQNVVPFPVQQPFDDTTVRHVSFSPNENTFESSDNFHDRVDNYMIDSTGGSWTHQRQEHDYQHHQNHSQLVCSSVDRRQYKQRQPNAIDTLFDFEDSIDMCLGGISILSATEIEHGAQYIKSSIEILDEAFALIRNVTESLPIQARIQTTDTAPDNAPVTIPDATDYSDLWSTRSFHCDGSGSVPFIDNCMTDFAIPNDEIDNFPNVRFSDLSCGNSTAFYHFDPSLEYVQSGANISNASNASHC